MLKNSIAAAAILSLLEKSEPMAEMPPLLSNSSRGGDFRRQAFRPSKFREYRERERQKNRASLKAMGLSGNVFDWPPLQMPLYMRVREPFKSERLVRAALLEQSPKQSPQRD